MARVAKKAKAAKTAKAAAKVAEKAKDKAGESAEAAKAANEASTATAFNAPPPSDSTGPRQNPTHVLKLRLTDDERERIERLAAEQDLPVPDLARSLLIGAIGRSDDD